MHSIRIFLISLLLATIVLTIFIAVLQGYQASSQEIQQQMDAKLLDLAKLLSKHVMNTQNASPSVHKGKTFAFQIISSKAISHNNHPDDHKTTQQTIAPLKQGFDEVNFNDYRWRSYAFFNQQQHQWIIVAERLDIRFKLVERTLLKSLTPIVLGMPLAALLIWFIVGHALKPLRQLANTLKNKRENDLSPLNIKPTYTEVEHVIQSSNKLLKRLRLSFEREKHFAANVAHELRTPLSVLKIDLFNLNQKSKESSDGDIQILNQSIDRMEHLIQQILTLYRTTPDQFIMTFSEFDLTQLTQKVIIDHYDNIDKKSQSIELQGIRCLLTGDSSTMEILLSNLIENANKYTPEKGEIHVTIIDRGSIIRLQIEDSGCGIEPTHHQRVFERFYRENGDCHTANQPGCGLGLSIVKHIVKLHKATISLHPSHFSTGLMVQVDFLKGIIND